MGRRIATYTFLAALLAAAGAGAQTPPHDHGAAAAQAAPGAPADTAEGGSYDVPPVDVGVQTLEARAAAQRATVDKFRVFHGFRLTDQVEKSGITFVHRIVDDAGKTYKAAHYDHGNGVAAADVDGDGRVDLYFTNQLGGNELWRNAGSGRFRNITPDAGVGLPGRVSVSASFADVDNDGDPDLYVTTVRMGNALFLNDGKGRFQDVTKAAGLEYSGHSSAAVFLDFDKDGLLDLFLVNVGKYTGEEKGRGGYYLAYEDAFRSHLKPERTERSILYRNLGKGRFADVSAAMGLQDGSWSGDTTITDFNRDGFPDLYVLNMQGDNHYWVNEGGKRFVDKTAQFFPKTPWGAMGIKSFDYDNDGDFDLYLTDMHSDMVQDVQPQDEKIKFVFKGAEKFFDGPDNNIFGNAFYQNQGDGTFREVSDQVWLENYWPWGVSVDDFNADGWDDVFIAASMNFPFRYGVNSLMLNNAGESFLDSEFLLGVEPRRGGRTRQPWFTLECSGADRAHRLCANRTGRITINGTLGTRSSVIFDLDDDGDLDLVTQEFNAGPQVFVSDLAGQKKINFLKVRLTGKTSNRNGLGAVVRVKAGGRTLSKMQDGTTGYLSHGILPLYFGLGDTPAADRIEVEWPSGRKETITGPIASGQTLDISEDGAR